MNRGQSINKDSDPTPQFQVGGSLRFSDPTYVTRAADTQLLKALEAGEFCYVLNSRQMGKSSLRVRAMQSLKAKKYACSGIDLTRIGSEEISPKQWYKGIISELERGFRLFGKIDKNWRTEQEKFSPVQRLNRFIEEILLVQIPEQNIVIFLDEIDSVLSLKFPVDDFFALIRACYNQRSENPAYDRVTFALFGVATPSDLVRDPTKTPFNIGCAIELTGFEYNEAQPLVKGLEEKVENPQEVLKEILYWTGGQPFLTQKLCQLVVTSGEEIARGKEAETVEKIVNSRLIENWEGNDEPVHLRTIRDRVLHNPQQTGRLLRRYQKILLATEKDPLKADDSPEHRLLCLSGLVVKHHGKLKVCNPIYAAVFDLEWIDRELERIRPYHDAIIAWEESRRADTSRLLRGQTLQQAIAWATDKSLTPQEYHFLNASQKLAQQEAQIYWEAERAKEMTARLEEEKKSSKYQRSLLIAISTALAISSGLGIANFIQYRTAAKNELSAIATSSESLFASERKLDALIEAIRAKRQLDRLGETEPEIHRRVAKVLQQSVDWVQEYNRLSHHSDGVWSVAFSPNQEFIATAGRDRTLKLWNKNGRLLRTLTGHRATIYDLAFSPDGQQIATSSQDKTIKLWKLDGTLITTLKGHQGGIIGIDFSPDGKYLVSGSRDSTVRLWQLDGQGNGVLVKNLEGHGGTVVRVAFSPDGELIASASDDKTVKLWRRDGTLAKTLEGHADEIYGVAFSPDGELIASASDDKTVKLWRRDGNLAKTLKGHTDEVYGLAFSPDGQILATGSRDKTVKLWQRDGQLITTLSGSDGEVWQVAFRSDGQMLASASNDGTVRLWKPNSQHLKLLHGHSATVWEVDFSPDGKILVSGGGDNDIKLWSRDGRFLKTLKGHRGELRGIAYSLQGDAIASASFDKTVKLWQPDGTLIATLEGHNSVINDVAFSPDGKTIVSVSDDETVKLWSRNGTELMTLRGHNAEVNGVAFSPDGELIASASSDRTIKLWQINGELVTTLEGHSGAVLGVAFGSIENNGNDKAYILASASRDKTVKVWRVKKGISPQLIETLKEHRGGLNDLAFSADGQMLASVSDDRTIALWNADGSPVTTLFAHSSGVNGVAFSPDGKLLASASVDNTIVVWSLERNFSTDALLKYGCNWVKNYLQYNAEVDEEDRNLCALRSLNP
ncbi:AAA-like domain-containing protein [Lusitaniella coriacea]|uniref:WD40 domain-containing protein n=1 Tax=Lusitaniella coriacea TaxID=1983105 RepID=UPI003CF391EF